MCLQTGTDVDEPTCSTHIRVPEASSEQWEMWGRTVRGLLQHKQQLNQITDHTRKE